MSRFASIPSGSKRRRKWTTAIGVGAMLAAAGCGIPGLRKADRAAPLPCDFNGVGTQGSSSQIGWHEFFNDPALGTLIDQAIAGNQELKIINQNIQIANFEVLAWRGSYLPFVGLRASADLEKPSRFTPEGAVEDQLQPFPGKDFPEPLPNFMLGAEASWEIDIWRRLRNARDAATLRYLGTQDGQQYMITRLVADVSKNYYHLMALDNRMVVLDGTIAIQQQSLDMSRNMKEAGRDTELGVQRFLAEVRKNQSQKLIVKQDIIEVENRINFLLGRFPQYVERDGSKFLDLQLQQLSVGFPAQLLQNRADIRQAERELQAAGLDVRVARARFYPSLNLRAGVGYEAFNTRYLFNSPESLIYNAGGDLVAPLINRKGVQAVYLTANAKQLQAVYDYQQTVLDAFREVINSLSKVENYSKSIDVKKEQLASLEASVDNATKLFQSGRVEYMDVLFSQRDLMDSRMKLIDAKREQLSAIVSAYQALGGGTAPSTGIAALPTPLRQPELILEQPIELKQEEVAPPIPTAPGEELPPASGIQLLNPSAPVASVEPRTPVIVNPAYAGLPLNLE
ncbi:TolC family protein [Lacipirellula sp.]|uniref:TolC family protein n=1 Tax=Lacipirellula sp. TaxID=2691419 RepID=UPI003D0AAF66